MTDVESYVLQIIIIIAVFVDDDLMVTGNDLVKKQSVDPRFALTDEGKLEYYIGGEVVYKDQNILVLHQPSRTRQQVA